MKYKISGATIITPELIIQGASIGIKEGLIIEMGTLKENYDFELKLDEKDLIFPGLINAHDHLLGNYYPRVGTAPYLNFKPWDNDLKSAPVYEERSKISNFDLYLLGAYRNIISGVTSVQDHIPHEVNQEFVDKLPLRVISNYTLQHECSSYDLKWGDALSIEHKKAIENDLPFITHIEEGFDEEAILGIDILREMGALDEHSVLIHGIALSKEDIKHIAKAKAHLVTCPNSNYFMFKEIADIKELMKQGVNISLGTDSPMSGGQNIFEEMQMCSVLYKEKYRESLDPKEIVRWVTVNPARALRLKGLGSIEIGNYADFLILTDADTKNPYSSLVNAWFENVKLVIMEGAPLYGYKSDMDFFKNFKKHYQLVEINNEERILIGKPQDLYERIWENLGFKKSLPFFPMKIY